jgi:hypothetical protein
MLSRGNSVPKVVGPRGGRGIWCEDNLVQSKIGLEKVGENWPKANICDEMMGGVDEGAGGWGISSRRMI